jgi:hypothetical protein
MASLVNPNIYVNGLPFSYKPNTWKFTEGEGESIVRVKTSGGGNRQTVNTKNLETQKSVFSFVALSETESIDLVRTWQRNGSNNVVEAVQGDWSRTFQNAIIVTDLEKTGGMEADFEVSWESDAAI